MVTIYKLINGIESELLCNTPEDAEAMVKSNPDKYSFEKRIKEGSPVKSDEELLKRVAELEEDALPAGVTVEEDSEKEKDNPEEE
jgi:hypothetical protein